METSVCSPSCTYCHPDTRSPLGCLCCSEAACKAQGILLVLVPAVQPLSVLRTERTAGIRPCSTGNLLATIPKHHLWGKFTAQSPLHGGCHKHWLCSGSQKHPCGRFQKLNLHTWDMVHVRLQDPGVLPHRATCSHAQNYRERASLVAWHSKKALHALCPLSRGGVTFRPNDTALKRSFFLQHNLPAVPLPPPDADAHPMPGLSLLCFILPPSPSSPLVGSFVTQTNSSPLVRKIDLFKSDMWHVRYLSGGGRICLLLQT